MYYGRRRHERRTSFPIGTSTAGKIFLDEAFIRSCTLHDVSGGGARLQVRDPTDIPDRFDLVLDGLAVRKPCRIVWRTRDSIGVEFIPDRSLPLGSSA